MAERKGFTEEEKMHMIDFQQDHRPRFENDKYVHVVTVLHNLCFAVSYFLKLIPYIFSIEGVTIFLSEKLNQDPLENFFGCQRQRG